MRYLSFAPILLLACACSSPTPSFEDRRAADHNRIGAEAFQRGELGDAALHFEQALEYARGLADRRQQIDALNNIGIVHETLGQTGKALEFYEQSLEMAAPHSGGDDEDPFFTPYHMGTFSASLNRSRVLLNQGRLEESRAALDAAAAAASEIGSHITRAACQKQRALLEQELGNNERAFDLAREAVRLYEISEYSAANLAGLADARLILGRLLQEQGELVKAITEFRSASRLARKISDRTLTAVALESIARALADSGHLEDARVPYEMALDVNRLIPNTSRARRNVLALREIGERLERVDLVQEYDLLLSELEQEEDG
ncbi:MAG: tetratricopeptide repeat protein [Planctomycetota bacterium]